MWGFIASVLLQLLDGGRAKRLMGGFSREKSKCFCSFHSKCLKRLKEYIFSNVFWGWKYSHLCFFTNMNHYFFLLTASSSGVPAAGVEMHIFSQKHKNSRLVKYFDFCSLLCPVKLAILHPIKKCSKVGDPFLFFTWTFFFIYATSGHKHVRNRWMDPEELWF